MGSDTSHRCASRQMRTLYAPAPVSCSSSRGFCRVSWNGLVLVLQPSPFLSKNAPSRRSVIPARLFHAFRGGQVTRGAMFTAMFPRSLATTYLHGIWRHVPHLRCGTDPSTPAILAHQLRRGTSQNLTCRPSDVPRFYASRINADELFSCTYGGAKTRNRLITQVMGVPHHRRRTLVGCRKSPRNGIRGTPS